METSRLNIPDIINPILKAICDLNDLLTPIIIEALDKLINEAKNPNGSFDV